MANNAVTAGARSYHGTTSVGNVDVVQLDKPYKQVEFICHDATNPMFVTVDRGVLDDQQTTPSGTRLDGSTLYIRIKDNGTARTLAWNAIYRSMAATLPTTTVVGKQMWLTFQSNFADGKYDLMSVVNQP